MSFDGSISTAITASRPTYFPVPETQTMIGVAAPRHVWSEKPPEAWTERQNADARDKGFLRPAWFTGWSASYGSNSVWSGPTKYLSVVSDNRLFGVMPIAFQSARCIRFAALAGSYMPFRGVVIFENSDLTTAQMVAGLSKLPNIDGVRLGPLPRSEGDLVPLMGAFRDAGWRLIEKDLATVFTIALPNTTEEFERRLPSKRKKRLRYYWNRMCKLEDTKIVHYSDVSADGWNSVFTELAIVENASWVSKTGDPRFVGEKNHQFWSHQAKDPWMRKAMHAWVIYHGGTPVSFCFAMDSGDTRYIIANSYDSTVAEFSTGSKIYHEAILDAIGRGCRTINIGMGDPGYKSRWGAEGGNKMVDVFVFPPTLKGSLVYMAAKVKFRLDVVRDRFSKYAGP